MRNIRLVPPKRTIVIDSPLQTGLYMFTVAAIFVALALGSVALHAIISHQLFQ